MEGLGCEREQSYPVNMEADFHDSEEEIPVNFLIEVPCLICGVDVEEIDQIVKQEVNEFEENLVGVGVSLDSNVFHWFLKWFRVDIVKKGKQRLINRGWDGHGGDILRFCGGCKLELMVILELQKQLDDLEERIKNGLGEVKGKIERFEGALQRCGIYERDQRYKRVRSRIVKCVSENPCNSRSDNQRSSRQPDDENPSSSRRSSRRPLDSDPLASAALTNDDDDVADFKIPIVMLSSLDKASADHHLIPELPDDDVKPEISLLAEPSESVIPVVSAVYKVKKTIRNKDKKKRNIRKSPEKKKKLEKKSVPKKILKKSKASKIVILEDDWDTNFPEDDQSDPDFDEDNPSGRPQRKKRKAKDEDFIPDDNLSSEDDKDDLDWNAKSEGNRRWNYKLDPSTNKITFGGIMFSISGDAQESVICDSCNLTMKNDKERDCMRRHMIKYHTNRFACTHCPYRGEGRNVLDTHIKAVHEGLTVRRKFPCKICGKPITCRRNHEWTHMNKEEREELMKKEPRRVPDWAKRKWQCEACGKSFTLQANLKTHTEKCHQGKVSVSEKPKELCPECGNTYADLKSHMTYQHGGPAKFECTEQGCGKRFKILSLLVRHKNDVHRKLKPWKCTMCTRGFGKEVLLKKHMDLHLGIRPWKCEAEGCGGAFATKGNLSKHFKCFHEEGCKPKRKSYQRGPTVLGVGFRKEELVKKGTYYPPSALNGWAKGRVPGHLMGEGESSAN